MSAIEFGPMALSIPQKEIGKIKKLSNQNNFYSLQHLIQITLIFIVLLNLRLIFEAAFIIAI